MSSPFDFGPLNYDPAPQDETYGPPPAFPIDAFRAPALGHSIGGFDLGSTYGDLAKLFSPGPATQDYMSFLSHSPRYEDNQPNLLQKIFAGLGSAAQGFSGHPEAGAAEGLSILRQPYLDAVERYKTEAGSLAARAGIERDTQKNISSILPEVLKMKEAGFEFGVNSNEKANELASLDSYRKGELINDQKKNDIESQYHAGQLSLEQARNAIAALEAKSKADLVPSTIAENTARAHYYDNPVGRGGPAKPNAALMKQQVEQAMQADPVLMNEKFYTDNGKGGFMWDLPAIAKDPIAFKRLQDIKSKYGGVSVDLSNPGSEEPGNFFDELMSQ